MSTATNQLTPDTAAIAAALDSNQLFDATPDQRIRGILHAAYAADAGLTALVAENKHLRQQLDDLRSPKAAPEPTQWEFADLSEETAAGLRKHFARIGGIPDMLRLTPAHWRLIVLALERAAYTQPYCDHDG